jgi:hypothetical protein
MESDGPSLYLIVLTPKTFGWSKKATTTPLVGKEKRPQLMVFFIKKTGLSHCGNHQNFIHFLRQFLPGIAP